MKKNITKLSTVIFLLATFYLSAQEPDAKIEGFTSGWANQTFNAESESQIYMFHVGASVSNGTVTCFDTNTSRFSVRPDSNGDYFELQLNFPETSKIIEQVSFSVTANSSTPYNGHYGWSTDGTTWTNGDQFSMPIAAGPCATYTVAAPTGAKYFRIMRNSSSVNWAGTLGGGQTIRILGVSVWLKSTSPTLTKTSGDNPASAMETLEMDPVVYTYAEVADDANVLYGWYTDNTYTTPTTAPVGLSITKDTDAKTVTVSGTPTTAGTYYYKLNIDEEGGNEIQGSVVVEAYVTPAPEIELTSGSNNQQVKAGTSITNIVYTLTYADGADITVLPTGLTANYDAGTYTISGTVDASVTPGTYNFTVTADPLTGYAGENVTATGSIIVKSSTAKEILYLTAAATPSAQDTKLYPMLNNSVNYLVTVKQVAGTAPASSFYDPYDLIVLNEVVSGGNAEANALINVNKPLLNLKSFQYNSGRWSWGTADNGAANNGTVTVSQPTHPIFAGITLNEGTLELLGSPATKGIQPVDLTLAGGISVATAPKVNLESAIAIHDVPANVRGESITSKYILVAIANDSYDKMSNDALTLLNNSVNYLLTGSQFVPVYTAIEKNYLSDITFDGIQIRNPNNEFIRVLDMSGRIIVSSDKDINMSTFNKGIYIIRGKSGVIKIALTK